MLTRPAFRSEDAGQEAIELAASVGLHLDPWQQLVVRVALAEQADGRYAASEVGFLVARQNGKGGILEAIALHGMFLVGDPLTLWTAHQTKTSFEAHQRMKGWVEGSSDLSRKVKSINNAHGDEGITLTNGVRLRFVARSKSSGRGFSPQRVILDEAQELSAVAVAALIPAMRAQPNKQSIYCGTVPGPETNNPEHWTRIRDRGRAGGSGRLAWAEWSPKGSDDPIKAAKIDLGSPRVAADSNPAIGYRVDSSGIADERHELGDEDAARELFSIWPAVGAGEGIFGSAAWATSAVSEGEPPSSGLVLGVAVSFDGEWASIGGAGPDGERVVLASVDHRRDTAWVAAEVKRIQLARNCAVVIDGKGTASDLVQPLKDAGVRLTVLGLNEVCDAYSTLWRDIRVDPPRAVHLTNPTLDDAHSASVPRPVGDRWAAGRKVSGADISMLEAVCLAAWGVANIREAEAWVAYI